MVFNRKVLNQFELDWPDEWYLKMDMLSGSETARLLAETFQNAGRDLAGFSNEQIALGLKLLTGEGQTMPGRFRG